MQSTSYRARPLPMGPVLYFDITLSDNELLPLVPQVAKFVAQRNKTLMKQKRIYFSDVLDVHSLADKLIAYCKLQSKVSEDSESTDSTESTESLGEDTFVRETKECLALNMNDLYIVFPKEKWIMDVDMSLTNAIGPYVLSSPGEVRHDLYRIAERLKSANERLQGALGKKNPYNVLKQTGYDVYAFRTFYAPIRMYLSAVIERKIFSAKDVYRFVSAHDIEENYKLIQRYIPYYVKGSGIASTVDEVLKTTGFDKPFVPPKGAKTYFKKSR